MSEQAPVAAPRARLFAHAVLAGVGLVAVAISLRLGLWRQSSPGASTRWNWSARLRLSDLGCGYLRAAELTELSLPKTRFACTGDAIRPRLHVRRCPRRARSGVCLVHPSQAKHEDATHYNRRRTSQGSAAGALR